MKEFTRYRINKGARCLFDSNTIIKINGLLIDLGEPTAINVTPNQNITFFGLSVKTPSDASKMIKWQDEEIDHVLFLFLKSNGDLVDNAFAYELMMDNELELVTSLEEELSIE